MRSEFSLDIFGQQGLAIYTQICHCYAVKDPSVYTQIQEILELGLQRLAESFPWIAGQVVNEGTSEGNTGVYKIIVQEKVPSLVMKDLRYTSSAPTWDELARSKFPFRLLDESDIAPATTLPLPDRDPVQKVFWVQMNIISDGLILTFLGHHAVMDGVGQGQIMALLSKACQGRPFTKNEVLVGNTSRQTVIPLLDDSYELGEELKHQMVRPPPEPLLNPKPAPRCIWAYFLFDSKSLTALKRVANEQLKSGYVSTDDVLTALIWKCVTRARRPRLKPTSTTTFARAVDTRRFIDIPAIYPGLANSMTYHSYTVQQLINEPIGNLAADFRSAVDPVTSTIGHLTRAYATYLSRTKDKNSINVTAQLDLATDIMLSSWGKLPCYELDFGLQLGSPEAVRRPQFTPVESLMYLMPRKTNGEIALAACLREEDMKFLREDDEFVEYAEYVP